MQDNSKQEQEGFFSLMFQFGFMMLVFWLICFLVRPLFPESKEYGEFADNGKRNFQYACDYRKIAEDESESVEEEILKGEEFTDASYEVERFVNDVYSMIVPVYNNYMNTQIEVEHIEVKQYEIYSDQMIFVEIGNEDEDILILNNTITNSEDISEEIKYEIMIALTEIYSRQIKNQSNTQYFFGEYEEQEFGPGIKRMVYEDLVDYYLEKDPNPISFFMKNQIPEFHQKVLEGSYEYLEHTFEECIENEANLRGWYTAIEALEFHLKDYYADDDKEFAYVCCLELILMPGNLEENGVLKEYAEQLIEDTVSNEYKAYLKKLI